MASEAFLYSTCSACRFERAAEADDWLYKTKFYTLSARAEIEHTLCKYCYNTMDIRSSAMENDVIMHINHMLNLKEHGEDDNG